MINKKINNSINFLERIEMKEILKPIFEMITGEYVLLDNVIYNYIALSIVGIIALKVAWDSVGKLYEYGIIMTKSSGSIIHWTIRLIVFVTIFYILNFVIWITKFIYTYKIIFIIAIVILIIFIIIFKIVKKIKK